MLRPMTSSSRPATRWVLPLLADLVCVVAFAFGGKSTHEAGDSNLVVLAIVWPYVLAALLAHAALLARGRPTARTWPEGAGILAVTYVLGMGLRAVSGRGIDGAFLLVAVAFLTFTLLGWRLVAGIVVRRRTR